MTATMGGGGAGIPGRFEIGITTIEAGVTGGGIGRDGGGGGAGSSGGFAEMEMDCGCVCAWKESIPS